MLNLGTITATLTASATGFLSAFAQADRAVSALSTAVVAVGAAATAAFAGAVGEGLRFAATLEQLNIGFTTMLGSAEDAAAFISSMQQFAAQTPFQFEDVTKGAQRLMAMGFAADHVIPLLSAIGDRVAALGGGAPEIQRVVTALGQMNAKGKVATQELNQLTEVGIGALRMLSTHLGQSAAETQRQIEARLITSATFLQAFMQSTSDEVGGMMQQQSTTLVGLVSTLKDTVSIKLAAAAEPMIAPLKAAIREMTPAMDAAITAVTPLISALGQVAQAAADVLRMFNALGPGAQRSVLLAVAALPVLSAGLVLLGGAISVIGSIVGGLATLGGALATVLAPEVVLPMLAALVAVGAGVALLTAALARAGETPMQTFMRLGAVIVDGVVAGLSLVAVYAQAAAAGFVAGFGPVAGLFDGLIVATKGLYDQASALIGLLVGAGGGWQAWYALAAVLGMIARYLGTVIVSALTDAIRMANGFMAILQPMIAGLARFASGFMGIVTGSQSAGEAFTNMGIGLLGALGGVLVGAGNAILVFLGLVISKMAVMIDAIPGMAGGAISQGLNNAADNLIGTASAFADAVSASIRVPTAELGGMTFDVQADVDASGLTGFNMELDTGMARIADYSHALDGLTGETVAAAKAAGAGNATVRDTTDTSAQTDAAMWAAEMQARAAEEALRPLKDGLKGMIPKEIGVQAGPLAAAFAGLRAAIFPAQEAFKDLGVDIPQIGEDLRAALATAGQSFLQEAGNLGSLISATMKGAKTGGAAGAALAAGVALLGMSASFDALIGQLDEAMVEIASSLDPLVAGIGAVLIPITQNVGVLLAGLAPVFSFVGQVVGFVGPILFALGGLFVALGGVLQVVMGILQPVMPVIEFVFRILYETLRFVGIIVLGVVLGIQTAWNAILGAIAGLLRKVGADGMADRIERQMADTAATEAALTTLTTTSWDAAQAQIAQTTSTYMAADAMDALTDSLTNVPSWYKATLTAYQSAYGGGQRIPAYAAGGVVTGPTLALIGEAGPEAVVPLRSKGDASAFAGLAGAGSGVTVVIESMTVVAPDPATFARKLARYVSRRASVLRGSPVPGAGRYGVE